LTEAGDAEPAPRGFSRVARRAAAAIALGAALFAVVSLRRYGVTIDEPALLNAGDRTLFALTHPRQAGALDFDAAAPPGFRTAFPRLPDPDDPKHYPVLPGLTAAATDATLGRIFGLGAVDGHHAGLAILSIFVLALYTLYCCRLLGDLAGIAAAVALACFPTAVGHALNDAKDWPCAGFYALTVLAAGVGFLERRPRHLWLAGLFFGLAISCKQNGLFAGLTVALALPFFYRLLERDAPLDRRMLVALLALPYVGLAIFFAAWPWLWWNGARTIAPRFMSFVGFGRTFGFSVRSWFSAHPLRCLVFMTPPLVLLAAAAGAWPGRRPSRERLALGALLTIWLLLPLARVALPHANYYDANRHFIEYVPALCALAGLGFAETWRRVWPRVASRLGTAAARAAGAATLAAVALALLWPVVEYHPFEAAYFNVLAGGLGGAQRDGLFRSPLPDEMVNGTEGDYWSSSLREGFRAARAFDPSGRPIGVCAWLPALAGIDSDGTAPPVTSAVEAPEVAVVYASPRGQRCTWSRLHALERWRPVLSRVTRDGGLIYEILGPRATAPLAPVSPPTVYDP
jgi:hypothetical protein